MDDEYWLVLKLGSWFILKVKGPVTGVVAGPPVLVALTLVASVMVLIQRAGISL